MFISSHTELILRAHFPALSPLFPSHPERTLRAISGSLSLSPVFFFFFFFSGSLPRPFFLLLLTPSAFSARISRSSETWQIIHTASSPAELFPAELFPAELFPAVLNRLAEPERRSAVRHRLAEDDAP